jgi:hypothetical protein
MLKYLCRGGSEGQVANTIERRAPRSSRTLVSGLFGQIRHAYGFSRGRGPLTPHVFLPLRCHSSSSAPYVEVEGKTNRWFLEAKSPLR